MTHIEDALQKGIEKIENKAEKKLKVIKKRSSQDKLFPLMTAGVAVFFLMVGMVVAAPYMFLLDVPATSRAHEYTPIEQQGRDLYLSLGCFYCHSQQVRASDWGIGNVSAEGDYVFDSPHALGTERTGPDLAQIGGMRPTIWEKLHHQDPRSLSPGSLMPNFGFLSDDQINSLEAYIQNLGQNNRQVPASITGGQSFHPDVPVDYSNASNPYTTIMEQVLANYDVPSDTYLGDNNLGNQWGDIFDSSKVIFTERCLSCHGGSGNGEGSYARHVVTQPANLHERIATFPGDSYHIWRVSEGVPGTAMPAWRLTLNSTEIRMVAIYEQSFVFGSARTISGDMSDAEGDNYANTILNSPPINGTQQDFENGQLAYGLYCVQCHGQDGQGDGPASSKVSGGYIVPEPANFTESGSDFLLYGRYVWKVNEGVETTNMPPWKWALSADEIYQLIFYVQTFSTPDDYNSKWATQYTDSFARNYYSSTQTSGMFPNAASSNAVVAAAIFAAILLWEIRYRHITKTSRLIKFGHWKHVRFLTESCK